MFYVYILFSLKDKKLYVGYTRDLVKRFEKHSMGFVKSTKHRRPLRLIYYEAYTSDKDAQQREGYLKGGAGKEQLKIQLGDSYQTIDYPYRFH